MRIIVLGASGYLGKTIYKKLKKSSENDVFGTCCKSDTHELLKINVLNTSDIKDVLMLRPDIIIWSIMDQEREMLLSQKGLNELVRSITKDVRLIYVSTTVGKGKDQAENIIPDRRMPDEYLSQYVNGKIEGESIIQRHSNHVIVRPGSIYGFDCDGNMDSRMKVLYEISKIGKIYTRTANMYASFVHVQDLTDAIIELAYNEFTGTINVSGGNPVSHYDFNKHLARLINIDDSFIIPDYKDEEVYNSLSSTKRKQVLSTELREIIV